MKLNERERERERVTTNTKGASASASSNVAGSRNRSRSSSIGSSGVSSSASSVSNVAGNSSSSVIKTVNAQLRFLRLGFIALFMVVIGFGIFSLSNSSQAEPTTGTCLAISKGGTGCDMEELRVALGIENTLSDSEDRFPNSNAVKTVTDGMLTEERFEDWIESKPKTRIKKLDFGTLPNATRKTVPHGLTAEQFSKIFRVWGVATEQSTDEKVILPYVTGGAYSAYSITYDITSTEIILYTFIDRRDFVATIYFEYEV